MKFILVFIAVLSSFWADAQSVPPEAFYTSQPALIRQTFKQPGLENRLFAKQISVYPNPANSFTWVVIKADQKSSYRITLFAADGRMYEERDYQIEIGINKLNIPLPAEDIQVPLLLKIENLHGPQVLTMRVLRQ